ncbi:hypothetical protein FMEXI_10402 [Fusarium mexicanum]|uniref:Uncharacterized protein n=1 Tax=Fusarium mexicanum TaxID=751941 RepID=A0A8H5II03_9HYPO|nr:hypothetical protein FMEXI_10402 [Fusarium mexicanum]
MGSRTPIIAKTAPVQPATTRGRLGLDAWADCHPTSLDLAQSGTTSDRQPTSTLPTEQLHLFEALQPCLDNRVEGSSIEERMLDLHGTQNDVVYAFQIVHNISDVARCLDISSYSCIKKGSLLLEDSVCVVDETTFKSADTNIFMAVRVVSSERRMQGDELRMNMEGGIQPGTYAFNEIYGDSYYSKLVNGGIAVAILSITVLDRSHVKETVDKLESSLDTSNGKESLIHTIINAYQGGSSNSFAAALTGTRTHVSLSCTGNGYLKTDVESSDVVTVLGSFLDFPTTVVEGAGWAWASTSTYTSNPSFEDSLGSSRYATLDYTLIQDLSLKLLDDYMSFKCLFKGLQATMSGLKSHGLLADGHIPEDLSPEGLILARNEIRDEMERIMEAINIISRDPWILLRQRVNEHYRGPTPSTDAKVVLPQQTVGTNGVKPDIEVNDVLEPVAGIEQLFFDFDRLQCPERWKHLISATKDKDSRNTKNTATVTQSLNATRREYQHRLDNVFSEYNSETEKQKAEAKKAALEQIEQMRAANDAQEKMKQEIDELVSDNDKKRTMLADEERQVALLKSELESLRPQAFPDWDPRNNLDIGFHGRTVMFINLYTMEQQKPLAIDAGRDNGRGIHGWPFHPANGSQQLKLTKANPGSRTSEWLIDCYGRYLYSNDDRFTISCNTSSELQIGCCRWWIRKSENGRGYMQVAP